MLTMLTRAKAFFQQDQQNLPGIATRQNWARPLYTCDILVPTCIGIVPYSLYWLRPVYKVCITCMMIHHYVRVDTPQPTNDISYTGILCTWHYVRVD